MHEFIYKINPGICEFAIRGLSIGICDGGVVDSKILLSCLLFWHSGRGTTLGTTDEKLEIRILYTRHTDSKEFFPNFSIT
jgi:hypothetical protein